MKSIQNIYFAISEIHYNKLLNFVTATKSMVSTGLPALRCGSPLASSLAMLMSENLYTLESEQPNPELTERMVDSAERLLGYKLPEAYLAVLKELNGGYLHKFTFELAEKIEGQGEFVCMPEIFGIGYERGIDGQYGSTYLIKEWGYPNIGIVISSEGHTAIMLNYSMCGTEGEPSVVFIDVEWQDGPRTALLASTFSEFYNSLKESKDEVW